MPQGSEAWPRTDMSGLLVCAHALLVACVLGFPTSRAWGYRPFVSTDAAVVDRQEVEIELGYFTLERAQGENTFTIPSLVLNYGLLTDVELVGELRVQQSPTEAVDVVDSGLFVKTVLKEGVLQGKEGISVAIEAGPLLPSTVPGERRFGFEGIGILSGRLAPFTYHVNLGGGVQRAGGEPVARWGVIGEWPVGPTVRVVGEINGEKTRGEHAQHTALLGVLWRPSSANLVLDAGIRRGFQGGPDWQLTAGVTFGFSLASRERTASR
jgi:hypothetical protein